MRVFFKLIKKDLLRNNIIFIMAAVTLITIIIFVPNFLTYRNIINVLNQSIFLCLLAVGLTPVLITGGIDLSLAAQMGLSGIVGALYMVNNGNIFIGILIMLLTGTIIGAFNGLCIAWGEMVPFIVTMSVMILATGLSTLLAKAGSVSNLPQSFLNIYEIKIFTIPISIIIASIVIFIVYLIISKSTFGRLFYLTGTSENAARCCGVKTKFIKFSAYMLGGLIAGVAAILLTIRMGISAPSLARENVILDYITAVVIGGVSIYGGRGTIVGAVLGAIFITVVLNNSMNMIGIHYYTIIIIKGFVLIFIVLLGKLKTKI